MANPRVSGEVIITLQIRHFAVLIALATICADALGAGQYADASRLAARLMKHRDNLFTFLDCPEVPYDNNLAERMIRPAVILRKTCQGNRSEQAAAVQAVLMSVYRTLKLRGHDPLQTIVAALKPYLATGQLLSLPIQSVAHK